MRWCIWPGDIAALTRAGLFPRQRAWHRGAGARRPTAGSVRRFVHVSSLAAREPQLSPYGASKRAARMRSQSWRRSSMPIIIRPPAVYGPGDRATLPLLKALTRPVAVIPARSAVALLADPCRRSGAAHRRCAAARRCTRPARGERRHSRAAMAGPISGRLRQRARGAIRCVLCICRERFQCGWQSWLEALARLTGKPGMVSRGKIARTLSSPTGWPRGTG